MGLGSNVGDRAANLRAAAAALERDRIAVIEQASLYETAPQGELVDQPDFLNTVIEIATALEPLELLDRCKRIERELGRGGDGVRHGPRTIDIDILLLGDLEFTHERLRLPHDQIAIRHFVLAPLLEIAPDLTLPDGRKVADFLPAVADQPVARLEPL